MATKTARKTATKKVSTPTPEPVQEQSAEEVQGSGSLTNGQDYGASFYYEDNPYGHISQEAMESQHEMGAEQFENLEWKNASNLDAPEPRPGFVQRWIRADMRSESDDLNWSNKMREGWKPRSPETLNGFERASFPAGRHAENSVIKVGGLVLCELPVQMKMARERAIKRDISTQNKMMAQDTESINRAHMGLGQIRRDESVSTSGRRPDIPG